MHLYQLIQQWFGSCGSPSKFMCDIVIQLSTVCNCVKVCKIFEEYNFSNFSKNKIEAKPIAIMKYEKAKQLKNQIKDSVLIITVGDFKVEEINEINEFKNKFTNIVTLTSQKNLDILKIKKQFNRELIKLKQHTCNLFNQTFETEYEKKFINMQKNLIQLYLTLNNLSKKKISCIILSKKQFQKKIIRMIDNCFTIKHKIYTNKADIDIDYKQKKVLVCYDVKLEAHEIKEFQKVISFSEEELHSVIHQEKSWSAYDSVNASITSSPEKNLDTSKLDISNNSISMSILKDANVSNNNSEYINFSLNEIILKFNRTNIRLFCETCLVPTQVIINHKKFLHKAFNNNKTDKKFTKSSQSYQFIQNNLPQRLRLLIVIHNELSNKDFQTIIQKIIKLNCIQISIYENSSLEAENLMSLISQNKSLSGGIGTQILLINIIFDAQQRYQSIIKKIINKMY